VVIDAAEEYGLELNEGQTLTEINRYSLNRENDEVQIDVHKVYQNPHAGLKAIPVDLDGRKARRDLVAEGSTVKSVLKTITGMIKDMPYEDIFPEEV